VLLLVARENIRRLFEIIQAESDKVADRVPAPAI